jgi:hypothetical protein
MSISPLRSVTFNESEDDDSDDDDDEEEADGPSQGDEDAKED